jgi:hypothetical protein
MTGFGAASRLTPGYAHATWDMMVIAVAMPEQPLGINESNSDLETTSFTQSGLPFI